jgi:hypothetical protein
MENVSVEKLKELGLVKAGDRLHQAKEFTRKCAIAYEHFRRVSQDQFDKFNSELRARTMQEDSHGLLYDKLVFVKLDQYPEIPPANVLVDLEAAQALNCFDDYEIAKITAVMERKDPILFGIINGCPDRFKISQWGDDVKVEDIIKDNEG